jgi:hypothetical protein
LLSVWPHRNDDLVGRERCKSVANGELDVCLTGDGFDRLTG